MYHVHPPLHWCCCIVVVCNIFLILSLLPFKTMLFLVKKNYFVPRRNFLAFVFNLLFLCRFFHKRRWAQNIFQKKILLYLWATFPSSVLSCVCVFVLVFVFWWFVFSFVSSHFIALSSIFLSFSNYCRVLCYVCACLQKQEWEWVSPDTWVHVSIYIFCLLMMASS